MFGPSPSPLKQTAALLVAVTTCLAVVSAYGAQPLTSATLTKIENRVNYGERKGGQSVTRPAVVSDLLGSNNFLLSEANSRAEIKYQDGTLVRIGQNTVFSFDSNSRTLALDKGSLIFHMPKGAGGGVIKTPSLTAAITGTSGKVSANIIAINEGVVKLEPSGRLVHAGEFARRNADGSITIDFFDPSKANDGKLVDFNGIMPGFDETRLVAQGSLLFPPDLRGFETFQRAQNLPRTIGLFGPPDRGSGRIRVPKDKSDNGGNGNGNPSIY